MLHQRERNAAGNMVGMRSPVRLKGTSRWHRADLVMSRLAIRDGTIWPCPKCRHLQFKLQRQEQIVAIEILDELATGSFESGLAGPAGALICLLDEAHDFRILCCEFSRYLRCGVRRTVVDDDDLDRPVRLSENTFHGLDQKVGAVVDGNYRGDEARDHHSGTRALTADVDEGRRNACSAPTSRSRGTIFSKV